MNRAGRVHDVIIVGSSPAGYTAAIYAARAQLDAMLIEGTSRGGALMTTTVVENYPGFSEGTTGPLLVQDMRAQAERFGAHLHIGDVDTFGLDGDVKTVAAAANVWHSHAVILAMGSAPRGLGVPGEKRWQGRGISTTAKGEGSLLRDKDVAVVGGGDAAMEEALFLVGIARSITIIHHRNTFRSSAITTARVRAHDKITVLTNMAVTAVRGKRRVAGLRLRQRITGAERDLPVSAVIVAVGHGPRSELLLGRLDLDPHGLCPYPRWRQPHLGRRCLRRRRHGRPPLPAGHHRGRQRLRGLPRRRTLVGRNRPCHRAFRRFKPIGADLRRIPASRHADHRHRSASHTEATKRALVDF